MDPFDLLQKYIIERRSCLSDSEPFFIFRDRSPVTPAQTCGVLYLMLQKANLNAKVYCFHGLRTRRSVDLLRMGVSVETIKKLGRWKSNVVYDYLRLH